MEALSPNHSTARELAGTAVECAYLSRFLYKSFLHILILTNTFFYDSLSDKCEVIHHHGSLFFCLVSEIAQSCLTLQPRGMQPARLIHLWGFLGKNTGVGCHFLLQGIFPTQGSNGSPTLQADCLPSEPPGNYLFRSYWFFGFFFFLPYCPACSIFLPQPGTESVPSAMGVQSYHWTTREVPHCGFDFKVPED